MDADVDRLSEAASDALMGIFCILLQPDRRDATVGYWHLSRLLTRFLTCMTTDSTCDIR